MKSNVAREQLSIDRKLDSEQIASNIQTVSSDKGVSVTEVWRGNLEQAPFILLGSEVAWLPLQESICKELDASITVIRVELTAACQVRTVHGIAALILNAIQSFYPVATPLCVLAYSSAARVAHTLAIRCLMLDLPVGFVGAIDPANSVRRCLEDDLLERIGRDAKNEECLGQHFDMHWFSATDSQPEKPLQRRLRTWSLKSREPKHFSECITAAVQESRTKPVTIVTRDPLLTIQFGRKGIAPYFCLAGAGANVTDFVPFSLAIDDSTPVFGLQSRALYEEQIPFGSVESAARHYVDVINSNYSTGSLHLIGHSFGGWLAYEMATYLQAAGREVSSLILFDCDAPGQSKIIGREYTRSEAILQYVAILEQAAGQSLELGIDSFANISCEDHLVLLHRKMVDVGLLPRKSSPSHLRSPVTSFEAALRTSFKPVNRFEGPTRLVLACRPHEAQSEAAYRHHTIASQWRGLTPQLEWHNTGGNHVTLLKEPNIAKVVRWLKDLPSAFAR